MLEAKSRIREARGRNLSVNVSNAPSGSYRLFLRTDTETSDEHDTRRMPNLGVLKALSLDQFVARYTCSAVEISSTVAGNPGPKSQWTPTVTLAGTVLYRRTTVA